ncbi:MAG: hypothetical protein F7B17_00255 [Desulfurococcales archaeon]|nr:hypothetical protein [Desulfurococcales archaeon]
MSGGWLRIDMMVYTSSLEDLPRLVRILPGEIGRRVGGECEEYASAGWAMIACGEGLVILVHAETPRLLPPPSPPAGGRIRVRIEALRAQEAYRALKALGDAARELGLLVEPSG